MIQGGHVDGNGDERQRFFAWNVVSMAVCSLDFAFLSARFSLSDFPDFFDMDLRGDLSDIIGPSIGWSEQIVAHGKRFA